MRAAAFICLLIAVSYISAGAFKEKKVKYGKIKNISGGPRKEGRRIKFDEEVEVEIKVGNKKQRVKLKKQDINIGQGVGEPTSAVYGNQNVVVLEECSDEEAPCIPVALIRGEDGSTYLNGNDQALVIPNEDGEPSVALPDPALGNHGKIRTKRSSGGRILENRRKREVVIESLTNTRVVKIMMFVDKGVLDVFMNLHNNDETAAKNDIIRYLGLMCNELTMHYQTLRQYGKPMTINGVTMEMNIATALVGVVFPPSSSTTGNFDWSDNNFDGTAIYSYYTQTSSGTTFSGVLEDFRQFVRTFSTSIAYDHAMAITGYNYKQRTYKLDGSTTTKNLLGTAWLGTLCRGVYKTYGYHTSIVEFGGKLTRTAAHELGHGMGLNHDVQHKNSVNCTDKKYIMSTTIFNPTSETVDTYYKFSQCSAADVEAYTSSSGVVSDFTSTCMLSPDEAFEEMFCEGFQGSQLTFDEQCTWRYGIGRVRLPESDSQTESDLQAGYVKQCVRDADKTNYPFRCYVPGSTSSSKKISEALPGTKCVAADGSLDPQNICYKGTCTSSIKICASSTSVV